MPVIPPPPNSIYYVECTGKQFIIDALDMLGALDVNEDPDSGILARDMRTLNLMMDSWNTEKLVTYAMTQFSSALTGGKQSYTIGEGCDFDTTLRPPKIENGEAWIRVDTTDYPLLSDICEQWASISQKSLSGRPREIFYAPDKISGTIMFYPVPDAAYTFQLWQRTLLAQIQDPNTAFYLPPGYAEAITNHLCIRLAPKYGKSVPQEVIEVATTAKANIKRLNMTPQYLESDAALLESRGRGWSRGDINSGGIR